MIGNEITAAAARKIADIDYPANPRGIGAPLSSGPYGDPDGRILAAESIHLDTVGRGVWLRVGPAHFIPCRAR